MLLAVERGAVGPVAGLAVLVDPGTTAGPIADGGLSSGGHETRSFLALGVRNCNSVRDSVQ